jgi:hypothetical protein
VLGELVHGGREDTAPAAGVRQLGRGDERRRRRDGRGEQRGQVAPAGLEQRRRVERVREVDRRRRGRVRAKDLGVGRGRRVDALQKARDVGLLVLAKGRAQHGRRRGGAASKQLGRAREHAAVLDEVRRVRGERAAALDLDVDVRERQQLLRHVGRVVAEGGGGGGRGGGGRAGALAALGGRLALAHAGEVRDRGAARPISSAAAVDRSDGLARRHETTDAQLAGADQDQHTSILSVCAPGAPRIAICSAL